MRTVALLGHRGFVGSALFEALNQANYHVTGVSRDTHEEHRNGHYDLLINSAMPSQRFWALNNPLEDFEETAGLTADLIYNWDWGKFVQISTVSARCQLDHPYGLNKSCAETLVLNQSASNLVIRLGGLYGRGLDKGTVFDVMSGNRLFVHGDSKYNFIDVQHAAKIIVQKLDEIGIVEIGARDQISLREIADHFRIDVEFGDRMESQHTENPLENFPEAKQVLEFVAKQRETK